MKKILKPSKKTLEYLNSKPSIYLVCRWARWGVWKVPFEKFEQKGTTLVPYVWTYNDHNGRKEQYELVPFWYITTGRIFSWTFHESSALLLAETLNVKDNLVTYSELGGNKFDI